MNDNSENRLLLRRVHIDNYKCMSNFTFSPFGDITLLLGKNGCGKSAVFEAADNLHRFVCREGKVADLFPASSLTSWNKNGKQSFELEAGDEAGEEIFLYRLVVEHELPSKKKARVIEEKLTLNGKPLFEFINGEVQLYRDDHTEGAKFSFNWSASGLATVVSRHSDKQLDRFRKWMRGITMLSLNVLCMKSDADIDDEYLNSDGGNFVSWYRGMLQENPHRMTEADGKLRDILPGYRGLRLLKTGGEAHRELAADFKFPDSDGTYKFSELSAGQRALIALYMIIFGDDKERVLLLDEPDNFVMLPEIQPLLMELEAEAGADLPQTVLISHHPEAMNSISSNNAVWLERETQSFTRLKEIKQDSPLLVSELFARGLMP